MHDLEVSDATGRGGVAADNQNLGRHRQQRVDKSSKPVNPSASAVCRSRVAANPTRAWLLPALRYERACMGQLPHAEARKRGRPRRWGKRPAQPPGATEPKGTPAAAVNDARHPRRSATERRHLERRARRRRSGPAIMGRSSSRRFSRSSASPYESWSQHHTGRRVGGR